MFKYLKNWLDIRRRQKELIAVDHWIWELEDQRVAAEEGLKKARLRKAQLEGELDLMLPPDELVRMIGVP